jgi:hypothetical protein
VGDFVLVEADVKITGSGGVKTTEIVEAIAETSELPHRSIRAALYAERNGAPVDPLDLDALRRPRAALDLLAQT